MFTYVFCDVVSGNELAQLPMTGVDFEAKFLDIGVLNGVIPTVDPKVRALDPWTASAPRRTFVVVEEDDTPVWWGIVWGAQRQHDTYGIKVTAATFESWLTYALLRRDVTAAKGVTAAQTMTQLVAEVASYSGGNIGLSVVDPEPNANPSNTTAAATTYAATDLKPLQDVLVNWNTAQGFPAEWRVDCTKKPGGGYKLTLLVTDDLLSDGRDAVQLVYPGNLLTFTDAVDGTQHSTCVVGAASGTDATGASIKLLSVSTSDAVGAGELAAGYPLQSFGYSVPSSNTSSTTPLVQATVDGQTTAEMLDRIAQGQTLSNLSIAPGQPALASYTVGDPLHIEVTHPGYAEWPGVTVFDAYRLTGRKVTVGQGGNPTTVELTVVPGGTRIPAVRGVSATIQLLARRIRMQEIRSGL